MPPHTQRVIPGPSPAGSQRNGRGGWELDGGERGRRFCPRLVRTVRSCHLEVRVLLTARRAPRGPPRQSGGVDGGPRRHRRRLDTLKNNRARTVPLVMDLVPIVDRWSEGKAPDAWLFAAPEGGPLRESNWKRSVGWTAATVAIGRTQFRVHDLRHTAASVWQGRGVASDASFRLRREAGAIRPGRPGTVRRRSRRQSELAAQGGHDRTALRQMPGCCAHSGCIRRRRDAVKATKKRSDEGRFHHRPVVTLTHSAWLVIRSLPVWLLARTRRWCSGCWDIMRVILSS